ncbi:MAG: hypothetical protein V2A71_04200, partial [Candidatus Eisenbacteria bacterium]
MKRRFVISMLLLIILLFVRAGASVAKELFPRVPTIAEPRTPRGAVRGVFGVTEMQPDTFYYGGTIVGGGGVPYAAAPTQAGWANRKMWSWSPTGFAGTPHSGLNMDGWTGFDNTIQPESYFRVMDNVALGASCVISGAKSLVCAATNAECQTLCYYDITGAGYGNNWTQDVVTGSYAYIVGQQITLTYNYRNETEPGYDSSYVMVQIQDAGVWVDHTVLAVYEGPTSGSALIDLDSYLPVVNCNFRIKFYVVSDGGASDEDGWHVTTCGAFVLDDYALSGSVTDTQTFETVAVGGLPAGWQRAPAACGVFARTAHLNDLAVPITLDPCVSANPGMCEIADSVMILADPSNPGCPHPLCQNNYIVSPIADFASHPGMPGKLWQAELFLNLPLNDHVFYYWQVRCKPGCESGGWSPWLTDNYVYYSSAGIQCAVVSIDVSALVSPEAEQAQMSFGVINYCDEDPWQLGCSHTCNATPYFDNATLATYGSASAPYLSMREYDYWQDHFAEDGTLNPTSTADTRTPRYLSNLIPPIFGDTLVCRGGAADIQVYFVFRVARVGAQQPTTSSFFTQWFPCVVDGWWYEARMDTAEVTNASGIGTSPVPGEWMCTFHEEDLVRVAFGLDEGAEILPNNLFTPGTRIEYFLKARYSNSPLWFFLPDTTGGNCEEFEILPGMRGTSYGSLSWPCLIVVNNFGHRGNWNERNTDRISRHLKANGFDFDVYNKLAPASDLRNGIGRWNANAGQAGGPGTPKYCWGPGATLTQFIAYTHCFMNTGNVYGYCIYAQDVDVIQKWLVWYSRETLRRFFWLSGDRAAQELNRRPPWGRTFLNTVMCATYLFPSYAAQRGDYTYCLQMNGMAGGRLVAQVPGELYYVRQNGCRRLLNIIGLSTATGCSAIG